MYTKFKNIYLIFFLSFLTACSEDFLERPPLVDIGVEYYWKTSKDLQNYIVQHYERFPAHGFWYSGMPREESNSDNLILATPNNVLTGERGATGGRWTSEWSPIRSINIFMDNYQKCQDPYNSYKQSLGEAHFFRAWYYFELVKKYGDVPWYTTQLFPEDIDKLLRPRDPRTMVIDSILSDLDKAFEHLNMRTTTGNTRLSKEAALAFKSRVALFEGTWQKYHAETAYATSGANPNKYFQACIDASEKLMKGGYKVGLHASYYDLFGLDNMNNADEVLLYRASNITDGIGNDLQYITTYAPIEMGVTWDLISSYLSRDGTPFPYEAVTDTVKGNAFLLKLSREVDPRFHHTVWVPGDVLVASSNYRFEKPYIDKVDVMLNTTGFQVKKFSNPKSNGAGKGGGGNSESGYILFRYGEVLLNYAEALYELKKEVATEALNLLRQRVGMPNFDITALPNDEQSSYGYPIDQALYEIRRERRVELALEGHRFNDIRRWAAHALFKGKRPLGYPFDETEFPSFSPPLNEKGLIDYYQKTMPQGYNFKVERDYLSPIPNEELTLNPNIKQNPGW
jgi:hypothetical protein